jgi:general secretion pathway protein K
MRKGQDEGIALISVMWLLLILALIVASVLATARSYYTTADTRIQSAKLKYAAEGAIQRAIYEISKTRSRGSRGPATNKEFQIGDVTVSVRIGSEAGRVNINRADPGLLRFLMIEAGADDEAARAIADSIADWRDEDSVKRSRGAEALDYRAAGYSYGPRNAPLRSLGELLQVMGMKSELFACLRDDLTIYTPSGGVDEKLASQRVKNALRMLRVSRSEGNGVSGTGRSLMNPAGSMSGNVLRIHAVARGAGGRRYNVTAGVRPSGNRKAPAWIHGWLKGPATLDSACGGK